MLRAFLRSLILLLAGALPARAQAPLRLALAANLQPAFPALKAAFEARHPGLRVEAAFGATGSLEAQIQHGAPFDLFLGADEAAARRLAATKRAAGTPFPYARGVLVLWVPAGSAIPLERGLEALRAPALRRLALANPRLAPYGAAAEAVLRGAGLWEALQPKVVRAENIAQAAQYAHSGGADAAFLAQSQLQAPALRGGRHWVVPSSGHPPLVQAGLVLASGARLDGARAFQAFLLDPEGQGLLRAAGYGAPR